MYEVQAITGIPTTADNKPSNGTVDGVDSFDTKNYAQVDPGTRTSIGEVDGGDKGNGGLLNQGLADAYLNNEQAHIVARNYLFINTAGTNTITPEDKIKLFAQQQAEYKDNKVAVNLFELA